MSKNMRILQLGLASLVALAISGNCAKGANVIFTFAQTTANGMDLFTDSSGTLISNSTTPNVFFALGYVSSGYDFTNKTRADLVSAITIIASSSSNWSGVGSQQASAGGKANVNFDNGGTGGYNTASYAGSKLVAVISQGVNPLGGSIIETTPLAIVRGSAAAGWDSVLAPDGSPNPVTQALNVADFSNILVGTYTSLVGNVNSTGTTKFDTIALIPEPSTSSLLILSMVSLYAAVRRQGGKKYG